ncbi:MAG: alpha/beta hydrolase [Verrucomicrobiota bacterium]
MKATWSTCALGLALLAGGLSAAGIRLEDARYPYPEKTYAFESQRQPLEMVCMDVPAAGAERGVVVLLHGKNFSGSYFGETAAALSREGYRVIMPDQIGFGKSTKPEHYHYTFQQLAVNTRALLRSLGVERAHVLGHSMGGMLATRYALMFPDETASLTLLNPIGLEDWQAKGVPYETVDAWYRQELAKTAAKIRAYQLEFYYDGKWREAYDPWVEQLASFGESPDYPRMAWNQALTYDMIFTQPVVHEFPLLKVPVLLIIGQRDRTALNRGRAPAEVRDTLGDYPELGRAAARAIPHAELVELDDVGHLPHIEAFDRFIAPCVDFLQRQED